MYIKIGLGILAFMLCPKSKSSTPVKVKIKRQNVVDKQNLDLSFSSDLEGFKDVKVNIVNPDLIDNDFKIVDDSNELYQRKYDKNKPIVSKQKLAPTDVIYQRDIIDTPFKFSKPLKLKIK